MAFKVSNETKVGAFASISIAILIIGYNILKGNDIFTTQKIFFSEYENIEGLQKSNPVIINGFKIGQVTNIMLKSSSPNKIVVVYVIDNKINIPIDSRATIASADILGSKSIQITLGESTVLAESGDTLVSSLEEGLSAQIEQQILPVKQKFEVMLQSLDEVLVIIQTIFNPATQKSIQKGVFNMKETLESMNSTTHKLDNLMGTELKRILINIEGITSNFNELNNDVTNITRNMSALSDSLAAANLPLAIRSAEQSLQQVAALMKRIEDGEGTMGQLVQNDTLYYNLQRSTHELSAILYAFKKSPAFFLSPLGRKGDKSVYRQLKKGTFTIPEDTVVVSD